MTITLKEYQEQTVTTAIYPGAGEGGTEAIVYLALGLSEVGEVFQHLAELARENVPLGEGFHAELGDLVWYVFQLYNELREAVEEVTTEGSRTDNPYHGAADLCIFVSEIQGIVKKALRDRAGMIGNEDRVAILAFLDLILVAIARLAEVTGTTLLDIAEKNAKKLADRRARGVLGGSGDSR